MRGTKARLHAETIRFASSARTFGATTAPRSSIEREAPTRVKKLPAFSWSNLAIGGKREAVDSDLARQQ
jgi:hypothetical protein